MAAIVLKLWHGIEFMLIYILRYSHDDVIKSKHFPRYWPFVRWIHWRLPGVVTRIFDVFFDLRLNKRLSKQSRHLWFETPSHSLWRHCNTIKQSQFASVKYCLAKALHITDLCRCFPSLDSIQYTLKVLCHYFNTLRMRQNGHHFADKRIFLNECVGISTEISLKFVLKGPINNIPPLVPRRRVCTTNPWFRTGTCKMLAHESYCICI